MKIHALRPDVPKITNKKATKTGASCSAQHHQGKNASPRDWDMIKRHMWFELVREGDSEAEMLVGSAI